MKNLSTVIFLLFILSRICLGNNGWVIQNSGTAQDLWSVYSLDCNNIWAVGTHGTIIHTSNGGYTWFSQYSNPGMWLQSVFFTSPNNGFAVGKQGIILRSTNGGNNWILQTSPMGTVELRYIQFINANTGTIAGGDAYFPAILRTTDGGNSWEIQNGCYPIGLKGVYFVDANTGYCSAWLGWIFKTSDGGTSWQCTHTAQSLEGLWFSDANTGTIVGYNGTILHTTNGGDSWVNQNPGPTTWYFGCYFENINTGYVTGNTGTLLKTTNGGQNWISVFTGINNNLHMISVTHNCNEINGNINDATIVGSGGLILHNSFLELEAPVLYLPFNHAPQNLTPHFLWSFINGAATYELQISTSNNFQNIIFDLNSIVNLQYTLPPGILNLGTTYYWRVRALSSEESGPWSNIRDFHTVPCYSISGTVRYNDNNELVSSGSVKALKFNKSTNEILLLDSVQINSDGTYMLPGVPQDSLDIGVFPNSSPPPDYVITYYPSTIFWQNATILYPVKKMDNVNISAIRSLCTINPNFITGTVSGMTFNTSENLKDAVIYAKKEHSFVGCALTDANGVYHLKSITAGNIKIIVDHPGFSGDSASVKIISPGNLESVNFYLKDVSTEIKPYDNKIANEFMLYQNYPNPFNPVTKIKFDIPNNPPFSIGGQGGLTTIKIYDITGREISTLINESLQPGIYEVTFDGSNLSSGIYFYQLRVTDPTRWNGEFIQTKKMLMLK